MKMKNGTGFRNSSFDIFCAEKEIDHQFHQPVFHNKIV